MPTPLNAHGADYDHDLELEVPSPRSAIQSTLQDFHRELPYGQLRIGGRRHARLKQWLSRRGRPLPDEAVAQPKNVDPKSPKAPMLTAQYFSITTESDDGRLNIRVHQKTRKISNFLSHVYNHHLKPNEVSSAEPHSVADYAIPPPLNIVMQVVGSRGDVQPFVSLGHVLKEKYGHRVRIATHHVFKQLVEENGIEFFNIGGDPVGLMAFMVKNPGLVPGYDALRHGDVGKCRRDISDILTRCWRSCIEGGDGTDCEDPKDCFALPFNIASTARLSVCKSRPFVADVIIANPPSFAHIHCAEKLGIPLHMIFTMPRSPSSSSPHPLANIQSSNAESPIINLLSYVFVESLTWQGLGDLVNNFRKKILGLDPIGIMWAPGLIPRLHILFTYCWSPALIPKPHDWGSYIDISGFFFLPSANSYRPHDELTTFLAAGPPPIYIGFDSIVFDDSYAMTKLILDAIHRTGQRALISKGWVGLGADETIPENVFLIEDVPHDWLFKRVSCVVHHGGAGTTAAGIARGRPTVVIPFFGDQAFWGAMVARVGAGPTPIPYKILTAANLSTAIIEALTVTAFQRAGELAETMSKDRGAEAGAEMSHRQLQIETCGLVPNRVAAWQLQGTDLKVSAFAVFELLTKGLINVKDLKVFHQQVYNTEDMPWDPFTGGAVALLGAIGSVLVGMVTFPSEVFLAVRSSWTDPGDRRLRQAIAVARHAPIDETSNLWGNKISEPSTSTDTNTSIPTPSTQGEHDRRARMASIPATTLANQEEQDTINHILFENSHNGSKDATLATHNDMHPELQSRSHRSFPLKHRICWRHRSKTLYLGMVKPLHLIAASKEVTRTAQTILTLPADLLISVVNGLHNMPLAYGTLSVRPYPRVTSLGSGLVAAGTQFWYGFYDGLGGLVLQPLHGAKTDGGLGLLKGVASSICGLVFKPVAGVLSLPAYTIRGLFEEARSVRTRRLEHELLAARTARRYDEWQRATMEERMEVARRWEVLRGNR